MSESVYLPAVEIEPAAPRSSLIWLHGLGADGHDFEPIVPYLELPEEAGVRCIFPHAPARSVTINMGMRMPAWYDIVAMDLDRDHDEAGILDSSRKVEQLLQREIDRGIPAERIVLAGFSQGGAIALHLGLRFPQRLAGILALSTYMLRGAALADEAAAANRDVPIFQAHGTVDPMVPPAAGQAARAALEAAGYAVEWHSYAMGHEVRPDQIREIGAWLRGRFAG